MGAIGACQRIDEVETVAKTRQLIATAPERIDFGDVDLAEPTPSQVHVRSRWGAAKHGTEMALYKGYAGPRGSFDGDLRLFDGDGDTIRFRARWETCVWAK